MSIDEITEYVESLGDVLTLRPQPGDGTPEIAWGDRFFYFAPDGVVPPGQPFATIVTKDYPDEPPAGLGDGVFRVNIDAGRRGQEQVDDPTRRDVVAPHPAYGHLGWVAVVEPGERTADELHDLLRDAHAAAKRRWERRRG
ncbi:DUF6194 family protein [Agromyces endophyticus]|uniref:DUF6194 family protein n=1 Tax=Agromyces sp. H17E-10 TaxID=2932244 RepID=UPI001FD3F898|nr:DUF6194 family protein [Agromyces sp. H17E-10]UOQ87696.1 DUF6194 family protein [Agromyces sp. H17E-10]